MSEVRLIDADALIDKLLSVHEIYYNRDDAAIAVQACIVQVETAPTVDAVPVDFINQKIVELQSCANQHFNDGHEILATCVWETIRLLGSFLKEWRGKEQADDKR